MIISVCCAINFAKSFKSCSSQDLWLQQCFLKSVRKIDWYICKGCYQDLHHYLIILVYLCLFLTNIWFQYYEIDLFFNLSRWSSRLALTDGDASWRMHLHRSNWGMHLEGCLIKIYFSCCSVSILRVRIYQTGQMYQTGLYDIYQALISFRTHLAGPSHRWRARSATREWGLLLQMNICQGKIEDWESESERKKTNFKGLCLSESDLAPERSEKGRWRLAADQHLVDLLEEEQLLARVGGRPISEEALGIEREERKMVVRLKTTMMILSSKRRSTW